MRKYLEVIAGIYCSLYLDFLERHFSGDRIRDCLFIFYRSNGRNHN